MEQKVDDEITFKLPVTGNGTNLDQSQGNMGEQSATAEHGQVVPGFQHRDNISPHSTVMVNSQPIGNENYGANLPAQQAIVPNVQFPSEDGGIIMNSGRFNIKPDKFDGSTDWEDYEIHFLTCSQLGKWDDKTKANMLAVSLQKTARTFYAGLSPQDRQSYSKIRTAFVGRFGSEKQKEQNKAKLSMYKRKSGESASAVGDEIRRLTQRGYSNFNPEMQEQLALDAFKNAISLEMKIKCIDRGCTTLEEAVNTVEHYEALFRAEKERKYPVRTMDTPDGSKGSEGCVDLGKAMQELTQAFHQMAARQSQGPTHPSNHNKPSGNVKHGRCFNCDQSFCPLNESTFSHSVSHVPLLLSIAKVVISK